MKRRLKKLAAIFLSISMSLNMAGVQVLAAADDMFTEEEISAAVVEYDEELSYSEDSEGVEEGSLDYTVDEGVMEDVYEEGDEDILLTEDDALETENLEQGNETDETSDETADEIILDNEELEDAAELTNVDEGQESGKCGENLTFHLQSNGQFIRWHDWETGEDCYEPNGKTLIISGTGAMYNYDHIVNPEEGGDYWLGENAPWEPGFGFEVTRLEVEEGVTSIGNFAFAWLKNLKQVSLPQSLTSIGEMAFHNCVNVDWYQDDFQALDGLQKIQIPSSVTYIGPGAFASTDLLETVNYDGDILDIIPNGFYDNGQPWNDGERIWNVFGGTVFAEQWGREGKCGENLTYKLTDNGETRYWFDYERQEICQDKDGLTLTISGTGDMWNYDHSFYEDEFDAYWVGKDAPWNQNGGDRITKIVIEPGVTSIGNFAFAWSGNLKEVSIPEGIKTIGEWAFHNCMSDHGDENGHEIICGLKEVTIPKSVISIAKNAFDTETLETVNYDGDLLDVVPDGVYEDGTSWSDIDCIREAFGNSAFARNWGMEGTCGENVTYKIEENGDVITWYDWDEGQVRKENCGRTLIISGSGAMYNYDNEWIENGEDSYWAGIEAPYRQVAGFDITRVIVEEGVTSIGNFAFAWMNNLQQVSLPESLKSIGTMAFHDCKSGYGDEEDNFIVLSGLKEITIPAGVTLIEDRAFANADALETVNYDGDLMDIIPDGTFEDGRPWHGRERIWHVFEGSVFAQNWGMEGQCGDNVTYKITFDGSERYWYDWENFELKTDHEGMKLTLSGTGDMWDYDHELAFDEEYGDYWLGENAPWEFCTGEITSIEVEEGITSVGSFAFAWACNLKEVKLPNTLKRIGSFAFHDAQLSVPIGSDAEDWMAIDGLRKITIPSSVQVIENEAFSNALYLETVEYCSNVIHICKNKDEEGNYYTGNEVVENVFFGTPWLETFTFCEEDSHEYDGGVTVKAATALAEGLKQYHCTKCNELLSEVIPKLPIITTTKEEYVFKASASKAQTVSLGAKSKSGAKITYKSNNKNITVSSTGKVTVKKGYAGKATITISCPAKGAYPATKKTVTVVVNKLKQPMVVKPLTKTYYKSTVAKKAQTFTLKVTNAKGSVKYSSDSKSVKVTTRGVVTVKKGTPVGVYHVTVKAAGKGIYDAGSKIVKITVK